MRKVLAWLLLSAFPCFALHESDAGKVDWHKELVGIPRIESAAVAPRFERTPGRNQRSFVVTLSKSNVLAAVNAVGGDVAWRHVLNPFDLVGIYRSNPGFVVTLSGPGGSILRSYESSTGHLIFETQLHKPEAGRLAEPASIGQSVAFSVDKTSDILVLTNAHTVRRIDGLTGKPKWEWTLQDQSSSVLLCDVISTVETAYVVGLQKSTKSHSLYVASLNSSTGVLLSSSTISSSISRPSDIITLTSSRSPGPIVAWLGEDGYIRTINLSPEINTKTQVIREDIYNKFIDVGIADAGIFVALKRDDTSHVIRMDQRTQSVKKVWEFANSASSSDQSESVYAGGFDIAGQPYVARTHRSHVMGASSLQLFAANGADGQGMVTGFTFNFDPITHGTIQHLALEIANPEQYVYIARVFYTTSSGSLQMWKQEEIQWTREESLAEINTVDFIDLPERKVDGGPLDGTTFLSRVMHQIGEARNFPSYAAGFGRRFLTGSSTPIGSSDTKNSGPLWRDAFGFRKLLVVATSTGKIFGIDTARGNIVWSRLLVEGSHGGSVEPFKLFATATVSDGKQPEIVLLAHRQSPSNSRSTVLYHFEALTGLNTRGDATKKDVLKATDLFRGSIADAYLVRGENKTVAIVGEDLKVRLYPDHPEIRTFFAALAPSLHFALENTTPSYHRLTGHQILSTPDDGTFQAFVTWSASLDPAERIQSVIRRPHEPVASIGKILGDRSTLFKYLNPHVVAVLTESQSTPSRCSVYLVDSAKGTTLYHAVVPAAGGTCATKATLAENWFVYHYYDEGIQALDSAKGYRMVSVELYEGAGIDDKTKSPDLTSFSYDSSLLTVFQQSFVFPHDITAIATTSTKFGISTKELVVANAKQQIQSFPRRLLDPRRPKSKPTAKEQEEWLIQYDPLIPDDSRRVLSHNYRVAGTQRLVTSPALLESTSIVLAYGLDLFLTRVAPSNTFDILSENFNKLQLVLTVVALGLGVAVAKPMVRRKQMKQRWYYS